MGCELDLFERYKSKRDLFSRGFDWLEVKRKACQFLDRDLACINGEFSQKSHTLA